MGSEIKLSWLMSDKDWDSYLKSTEGPISLCIGNFDGVHLGHQELIRHSVAWAQKHKGVSAILTFDPHPQSLLHPEKRHSRLFDWSDLRERVSGLGVSAVFIQAFSRDFSEKNPLDFFQHLIVQKIKPKHIVVGFDFYFGKGRSGNIELLKKYGEEFGIKVEVVPAVQVLNEKVSTSKIREALLSGDLRKVESFLDRSYYIKGIVVKGDQRGRMLGFPTANVHPSVDFFPRLGVYVTQTHYLGEVRRSVTNVGSNRTFKEGDMHPIKVETHILDVNPDLYGHEIKVDLLTWLRDEKKFSNIDELKKQIAIDSLLAKEWQK